jgi:chemotaxis regulatin CheY-phosphate phosphatase CheZ
MNSAVRRPFAAERRKTSAQAKDVTIADLMQKMTDLESGLNQGFSDKFDRLCEQLEVIVEDENETKVTVNDVMAEIHAMNAHIVSTKEEVAALKPADEASTTVTAVAAELSEVVKATEDAANTILENVESMEAVSATMRENVSAGDPDGMLPDIDRLENISMELLTACSFQDITGQRITKVVNSLDYIEARLQKMIEIWKVEHGTADTQAIALGESDERPDKDMLHGPQDDGMDQDSIDALFE